MQMPVLNVSIKGHSSVTSYQRWVGKVGAEVTGKAVGDNTLFFSLRQIG